jgi:hypothetical protein
MSTLYETVHLATFQLIKEINIQPKMTRKHTRSHLIWRDQHTPQEDGTDEAWPTSLR